MHGTIFVEMKKFVESQLGAEGWRKLLQEAGVPNRIFMPVEIYPDEEAVKIVMAASRLTKKPADEILESFGAFMAPGLIGMYKTLVKPHWRTLDLIENTENTIHEVVRKRMVGSKPPILKVARVKSDEVVITYGSARRLCAVARGLSKGIADYFGERVSITEMSCMNRGARECKISVKLLN